MFDWGKFRNFALVKPKDVHQPLGWQALLTSCEVLRTLSLGIWVLGVRWWWSPDKWRTKSEECRSRFPIKGHERKRVMGVGWWVLGDGWWRSLRVRKKSPYAGRFRGSFQLRFSSVPKPFQVRSLKWDLHGSHKGVIWEVLRISNRDK